MPILWRRLPRFALDELVIDIDRHEVTESGRPIALTPKELNSCYSCQEPRQGSQPGYAAGDGGAMITVVKPGPLTFISAACGRN